MQVRALGRGVRMSPRKVQLVVETIRGRPALEALALLRFAPQAAARAVSKIVRSAVANAENNYGLDADDLYVVNATADQGPRAKRFRARSRGMASPYVKRTTHITVVVDDEPGRARRLAQRQTGRPAARAR
ncbi:MAG: 50S ribosomal protein L22 [Chloroflexi bacterium]|nr:50S ribosomal protein L22 [Chloroflexota bacterium]